MAKQLEFKGKLIHAYPVESGTSASGNQWQKRTIVLENEIQTRTGNTFTEQLACEIWSDKVEHFKAKLTRDAILVATCDVTSNESTKYPGRWFTSARVYLLETEQEYNARVNGAPSPELIQAAANMAPMNMPAQPAQPSPTQAVQQPQAQPAASATQPIDNDNDDLPF